MPPISNLRYTGLRQYVRLCLEYARIVIIDLIFKTETRSAELAFGFISIGWWLVLSISPAFDVENLYNHLLALADQDTWAVVMLCMGAQQITSSVFGQRKLRFVRAFIWMQSFVLWSYIAWGAVLAVPVTTAAAAYSVLAIGSAWAFVRSLER